MQHYATSHWLTQSWSVNYERQLCFGWLTSCNGTLQQPQLPIPGSWEGLNRWIKKKNTTSSLHVRLAVQPTIIIAITMLLYREAGRNRLTKNHLAQNSSIRWVFLRRLKKGASGVANERDSAAISIEWRRLIKGHDPAKWPLHCSRLFAELCSCRTPASINRLCKNSISANLTQYTTCSLADF